MAAVTPSWLLLLGAVHMSEPPALYQAGSPAKSVEFQSSLKKSDG
jgi:hypothetical protein